MLVSTLTQYRSSVSGFGTSARCCLSQALSHAVASFCCFGVISHADGDCSDLKPENILLSDKEGEMLKISDFGLSRIVGEGSFMKTLCGTPQYLAPEVIGGVPKAGYDKAVDLWSIGCVLYILLSGLAPFTDANGNMVENVKQGKYSFPQRAWKTVSESGTTLVKQLLCVDPAKRLTIQQMQEHPWILGYRDMAMTILDENSGSATPVSNHKRKAMSDISADAAKTPELYTPPHKKPSPDPGANSSTSKNNGDTKTRR